MDATWPYQAVYPAISFLLDEIEVGKFGSNVTLLSSFDGSVIINTTASIAEFHANYTEARHRTSKSYPFRFIEMCKYRYI